MVGKHLSIYDVYVDLDVILAEDSKLFLFQRTWRSSSWSKYRFYAVLQAENAIFWPFWTCTPLKGLLKELKNGSIDFFGTKGKLFLCYTQALVPSVIIFAQTNF